MHELAEKPRYLRKFDYRLDQSRDVWERRDPYGRSQIIPNEAVVKDDLAWLKSKIAEFPNPLSPIVMDQARRKR